MAYNIMEDLQPVGVDKPTGDVSFEGIRSAIAKQESQGTGGYSAVNKGTGALGMYQIVPKWHFNKIGLTDTPENRQLYLKRPDLQDQLFDKVISEYKDKYGTIEKAIAAYYGGGLGAKNYGTKEGDVQGKYKNGKPTGYPSINEYVSSVLGNVKQKITQPQKIVTTTNKYKPTRIFSSGGSQECWCSW